MVKFEMADPSLQDQHKELSFIVKENSRRSRQSTPADPSQNTDKGLILLVYHMFKGAFVLGYSGIKIHSRIYSGYSAPGSRIAGRETQVFRNKNSSQTNAYSHYSNYSYFGLISNERALRIKNHNYLRNRKHVPCFYRVIHTRVEVWENEIFCGNTSRRQVFPQLFRVLPNFHECLYNSIETQSTCFLFLLENNTTRKRKTTC